MMPVRIFESLTSPGHAPGREVRSWAAPADPSSGGAHREGIGIFFLAEGPAEALFPESISGFPTR